jgi:hypothetical protein
MDSIDEKVAKAEIVPFKERLMKLQSEIKVGKDKKNDYGHFWYRSNEGILEVLKPLLPKYQMLFHQTDFLEYIEGRFYIKAVSTLTDLFTDASQSCSAYAREPETHKGFDQAQITGASSSYSRKYSVSGLLLLDDENDPDKTNDKPQEVAPKLAARPRQGPTVLSAEFKAKIAKDTANFFVDDQWREKLLELKKKPHFTRDHEIYYLEEWDKFTDSQQRVKEMEGRE